MTIASFLIQTLAVPSLRRPGRVGPRRWPNTARELRRQARIAAMAARVDAALAQGEF